MRIALACLVILFPVFAFASAVEPKDKYVNCNCHLTPGTPWKGGAVSQEDHPVIIHHHHKAVRTASATPAQPPVTPVRHKTRTKKAVVQKETSPGLSSDSSYPGKDAIVSSNKLPLPAGKSIYSSGQLVYISGRVLDMRCVPVSDAVVEIWQTNPDGRYVKTTLGERLSPSPVFTGTGRATTDNLGRFNFVTVFPGTLQGRAPFIHVRVLHKDFSGLDTEMFFSQETRNAGDPVYSSMSTLQRQMLTAKVWQRDVNDPDKGLGASWDISLNWKNPWRRF